MSRQVPLRVTLDDIALPPAPDPDERFFLTSGQTAQLIRAIRSRQITSPVLALNDPGGLYRLSGI